MIEALYSKYLACACRVTTDSRKISGGEIFFALKGENFDGNQYAEKALEAGAAWAVVDDAEVLNAVPESVREKMVLCDDVYETLKQLAIWHREHVRDGKLPVFGLTGTNGKTTTKNLIAAVLNCKYRVTATQGNYNNDIGVPLTLLSITPDTEFAIVEMGANHPDDITKLVQIARPDYGLITNVGRGHLLGFGSFEGVKAAKGELYRWLSGRPGSVIFINEDDADLKGMANGIASHFYGYGKNYQGVEILPASAGEPFLRMRVGGMSVSTKLVGAYNCANVLAALCVGSYFGVPADQAVAAVESFVPDNHRSQMVNTGRNSVILDAYNANPASMSLALDSLRDLEAERKAVMLGDMKELGADSLQEHLQIVRKVLDYGFAAYLVGAEFRNAVESLPGGSRGGISCWDDVDELIAGLADAMPEGATVLVKGSHSMHMEKLARVL